jgi:hypothetical protein
MSDESLRAAEQFLATGDYSRALAELGKVSAPDAEVTQMVRSALDRMKSIAAREFVQGRWTVAEGLFGQLQEQARFLLPAERAQCEQLVKGIRGRRDSLQSAYALIQAAAQMAAECRFPESRELALRVMRDCTDAALVGRLRRLLRGLPHPMGQLLFGFDCALEVERFTRTSGKAHVSACLEERHALGGGYARVSFGGQGDSLALLDPPPDWTAAKELSFWVRSGVNSRAQISVQAGDAERAWVGGAKVWDPYWNQLRLPLASFAARGTPSWSAVKFLTIELESDGPAMFDIDDVRLK